MGFWSGFPTHQTPLLEKDLPSNPKVFSRFSLTHAPGSHMIIGNGDCKPLAWVPFLLLLILLRNRDLPLMFLPPFGGSRPDSKGVKTNLWPLSAKEYVLDLP